MVARKHRLCPRVARGRCGTGIFTRLLLDHGNVVHAIEPNDGMRAAAEAALGSNSNFVSINATAEATTLPDHSVDLVATAQAFHWFDPDPTRREFNRILKPGGWVLIVFNTRRDRESAFMQAYEDFLHENAVDYPHVDHRRVDEERLRAFFGDYREWRGQHTRVHDLQGVMGLSSSSSYTPAPDHPRHAAFYDSLRRLFAEHQKDGHVEFLYQTEAYLGRPRA